MSTLLNSNIFQPGVDDHISALTRSLETQHFLQHMSCSKQWCNPTNPNDIPQASFGAKKFPEIVPSAPTTKGNNFCYCVVYSFDLLSQVLAAPYFRWLCLHDVRIPGYRSICQDPFMTDLEHKCGIRAISLQTLVNQGGRISRQLHFAHSTLLTVVNAHTTSYIVSNAFWEILCHVFVFIFLCRLSAAIDNILYTFGSLHTQPAQWRINFSINRVLNKNCSYTLLFRCTYHIPSVPFSKKTFQNHVKDSRSAAYSVSCETAQCKTFSF